MDTFLYALRGDPPARVEQKRVQLEPRAKAVIAKLRRYDPVKIKWLATFIAASIAFVVLVINLQAVWASLTGGAETGHILFGQRRPGGERTVGNVSGGDASPRRHAGVAESAMLRQAGPALGVWEDTLAPETQEIVAIVTPDGLFSPTRFP